MDPYVHFGRLRTSDIATPSCTNVLTDISNLYLLHERSKLQQYTVSQPSRSWAWYSPPWENKIPQIFDYLKQYPYKLRSWYSILRRWICLSWWTICLSFVGPESRLPYSQDLVTNPYQSCLKLHTIMTWSILIFISSISCCQIGFFFFIFQLKFRMCLYFSHTTIHNYTSITPFLVKN